MRSRIAQALGDAAGNFRKMRAVFGDVRSSFCSSDELPAVLEYFDVEDGCPSVSNYRRTAINDH